MCHSRPVVSILRHPSTGLGQWRLAQPFVGKRSAKRDLQAAGMKNLAVFVSGGGSNMKAIHKACIDNRIDGDIKVIVTDVPSCGGVTYAQEHDIPVLIFPAKSSMHVPDGMHTQRTEEQLTDSLIQQWDIDLVVLAGYLKLVPPSTVSAFSHRMLNIHPGLLPAFGGKGMYGRRVHEAVIRSGCRYSGPTIHFVDENYDTGPILAQKVVPCYPSDTPESLAARVLKQEHELYPEVVAAVCDDRLAWRDDGIPYIWTAV